MYSVWGMRELVCIPTASLTTGKGHELAKLRESWMSMGTR
jgi:hypothetical protein